MFLCLNTGGRTEDNAVIHEEWCVVRFKRVLQIHILEGLPSKRYQVHQQRAPDLCDPTFQLTTGYTPILDSRSQTSALKWQRPRPHASRGRSRIRVEVSIYTSSYVRHHVLNKAGTTVGYSSSPWCCLRWQCRYCYHTFMCTNITGYICVAFTYIGVDMHTNHSHHTFRFHKHHCKHLSKQCKVFFHTYHGKYPSKQCKVTDREIVQTYLWCSHNCIFRYIVNIFSFFL